MSDELIGSSEETDVGVISISDRRRIKDLEAKAADLEQRLAEALEHVKPVLTRENTAKDSQGLSCHHSGGFIVSDNVDEIRCKQCNHVVSPYTVARKLAHREINFCYTLNALRRERKELEAAVQKLKAAKGRLRRRVRGADDVPPAGIADLVRRHKLCSVGIGRVGGGSFVAVAIRDHGAGERRVTTEGRDPEEALALLLSELDTAAAASSSQP